MNKNLKKPLMLCSLVVVGFGLSLALAQVDIKSDLSNAIQNIQKVYFSPEGIKDPDQNKNILVELEQGALRIHGKVIIENPDAAGNTIAAQASGSAIIQGKENNIAGENSISLGGQYNTTTQGAHRALIAGGAENFIHGGSQGGVLFGGEKSKIKTGSNSAIAAGRENEVEGTNSFVAGGNLVTIKGDQSFAAGKNIKANPTSAKNAVFLWSDSDGERDQQFLTPEKDDTFLIRSANGLAIGKNVPEVKGVDVQGLVQIGDQTITCNPQTNGAIKYIGDQRGCFCSCNGQTWLSMSQSRNCMNRCQGSIPPVVTPVNGQCGSANGRTDVTTLPSGSAACAVGAQIAIYDLSPSSATYSFQRSCEGVSGGLTEKCAATGPKSTMIHGQCGSSHGKSGLTTFPSGTSACLQGALTEASTRPDHYYRNCAGANGGSTDKCSACRQGYLWENGACKSMPVSQPSCIGPTPANATLVVGDDQGLKANTPKTLVASNTPAKCEYICNAGYTLQNNSCAKLSCTGSTPANATLVAGDDQGLHANTPKTLVTRNTPAKCEYVCNAGYTLQSGIYQNPVCVKSETYKCNKEDVPEFAEFYTGDDKNLTANLRSIYSATNTSRKCEWKCKDKYESIINNGQVLCVPPFSCSPNKMAFGVHSSHQSDCKNKTGKDRCENAGWDGYHVAYSSNIGTTRWIDELKPHEIVIEISCHGNTPTEQANCANKTPGFIGRKLGSYHPYGQPIPYAIPTVCKWSRIGENGLEYNF